MKKQIIIPFFCVWMSFPILQAQNTWYVNQNSTGTQSGNSWINAFHDLKLALTTAVHGDAIWIAKGTYFPDLGSDRNQSFVLKSGVQLLGGFLGNENSISQRNISQNETILSGNIGNKMDITDNSYTILFMDHPDSTTIVDGLTLSDGQAISDTTFNFASPTLCGAAVYIDASYGLGMPLFKHCRFVNNNAKGSGGAIYTKANQTIQCLPRFKNCIFSNNHADQLGGAIYMRGGALKDSDDEFYDCEFYKNISEKRGGAIFFQKELGDINFQIKNSIFKYNESGVFGSCLLITCIGSGFLDLTIDSSEMSFNCRNIESMIHVDQNAENIIRNSIIKNSKFLSNAQKGNPIPTQNNLIFIEGFPENPSSFSVLYNNIFDNNRVVVILAVSQIAMVNNNRISKNYTAFTGVSAIFGSNSIFEKNIVKDNRNLSFYGGGGVIIPLFSNNLFIGNQTINGLCGNYASNNLFLKNTRLGFELPNSSYDTQTAEQTNNIFIGNTKFSDGTPMMPIYTKLDTFSLKNNILDHPCEDFPNTMNCLSGNIVTTDIKFIDTAAQNYRIFPCSPAINAGSNTPWAGIPNPTDIAGNPRIQDSQIDIGPYESNPIMQAQIAQIMASCGLTPNGSVKFNLENGCPPFNYNWQKGTQAGNDTVGLAGGNYQFTVTDARGKQLSETIQIPTSDPQIDIIGDQIICADAQNGMLTAVVSGAQSPIISSWNTGQTDPILDNLSAGTYIFNVIDANKCVGADTAYLEEALPTTAQFTVVNATGTMKNDGSIILNLISGFPPFKFKWSNCDTTGNPINLLPGNYILTVTNGIGCEVEYNFVVDYSSAVDFAEANLPATVHPNPANDQIILKWGAFEKFELFDNYGCRVLYREPIDAKMVISVADLASGVYPFSFSQKKAGNRVSGKLVVRH
jgi:predicted outer membrane repeat protein